MRAGGTVMWRKLYSNSGLVLMAVLAAGIWTSNIQDFLSAMSAPKSTLEAYERARDALTTEDRQWLWKQEHPPAPTPTPTPRKSAEEILGITSKLPRGPRLSVVEIYEQERARQAPTPAPKLSAVEIFERYQRERDEALRQSKVNTGATAICKDGFYSFSATRRGTCSQHGGVKVWLRR